MKLLEKNTVILPPETQAIIEGRDRWRRVRSRLYTRPGYVDCDQWELVRIEPRGEIRTFLYRPSNGLGGVGARRRRSETSYPL